MYKERVYRPYFAAALDWRRVFQKTFPTLMDLPHTSPPTRPGPYSSPLPPPGLTSPPTTGLSSDEGTPATPPMWRSLTLSLFLSPLPPSSTFCQYLPSRQGKIIFEGLVSAAKRGVKIRVVQNTPTSEMPDTDSQLLASMGAAEVRNLSITALTGHGILHTKMWVVDQKHFFVGSANLDWRSFTQVWILLTLL